MRKLLFIVSFSLLTACSTTGNTVLAIDNNKKIALIKEGTTTQSETLDVLGNPLGISFTDGGLEIWRYTTEQTRQHLVNFIPVANWLGTARSGKRKELVILFDQYKVASKVKYYESDIKISTGIY